MQPWTTTRALEPFHRRPIGRQPADDALRSMVSSQVSEQRRRAAAFESAAAPAARTFAADEGEVWAEIGRREARAGRQSATSALHELYEAEQHDAGPLADAFPPPTGPRVSPSPPASPRPWPIATPTPARSVG
jgi:hypothetical protein